MHWKTKSELPGCGYVLGCCNSPEANRAYDNRFLPFNQETIFNLPIIDFSKDILPDELINWEGTKDRRLR